MSGLGFSEVLVLCVIGLIVLGPERLPRVANKIGGWIGQARRMTRVMRRQLEDELNFDEDLNVKPSIQPPTYAPPRDDDEYSPLHGEASDPTATDDAVETAEDDERERQNA